MSDESRWKVLLVDDEPAVHQMSRLILASLSFEGRGIELLEAGSAAEARELLARERDVALALIDVVMETDDAGIALVQHIREALGDHDMQLVLRTGQPGMAPEGDIVPRYEINGYFLKTELTAQRLHSIVISALRGYRHARALRGASRRDPPGAATDARARELVHATEAGGVLMQAQPQIELATNRVVGVELVPLWRTSLGVLPVARVRDALPAGAARQRLARWMIGQACAWARAWREQAERALTVSVPLVAEALDDAALPAAVVAAVRDASLPRGTIDLLVPEAVLLGGSPRAQAGLQALRDAGLGVTLDDFGARTIALQRLGRAAPDRLKLHRLFVRDVTRDAERMAMARSLIALAQTLGAVAIADGIGCDDDAQFFRWEGCELGQGDALAPACVPADVAGLARQRERLPH